LSDTTHTYYKDDILFIPGIIHKTKKLYRPMICKAFYLYYSRLKKHK